jgi:LmbE family N-acetylglucosaminyl deacetylase
VVLVLSKLTLGGATIIDKKEVNYMPKYLVQAAIPTVYVIDVQDEQDAMQQAAERFKTEHNTQLEPEMQWAELTGADSTAEWCIAA